MSVTVRGARAHSLTRTLIHSVTHNSTHALPTQANTSPHCECDCAIIAPPLPRSRITRPGWRGRPLTHTYAWSPTPLLTRTYAPRPHIHIHTYTHTHTYTHARAQSHNLSRSSLTHTHTGKHVPNSLTVSVTVRGTRLPSLVPEYQTRLARAASACPVKKMVTGVPIHLSFQYEEEGGDRDG